MNLAGFAYVDTDKGFLGKDTGSRFMKVVRTRVSESMESHEGTKVTKKMAPVPIEASTNTRGVPFNPPEGYPLLARLPK